MLRKIKTELKIKSHPTIASSYHSKLSEVCCIVKNSAQYVASIKKNSAFCCIYKNSAQYVASLKNSAQSVASLKTQRSLL
jgi:hypothetical protein